jgi:predicted kinase
MQTCRCIMLLKSKLCSRVGKSTFSNRLLSAHPGRWAHINQDTISNGRPGKRQQCIDKAAYALRTGINCVIDRTNTTVEQRQDFIALSRSMGCDVHSVVLHLPVKECQDRVEARVDHPTLKPGPGSRGLVRKVSVTCG